MNDKIENVKSRIDFVIKLTNVKDSFRGAELISKTDTGWTHPFVHFSALRYYLILTCFDILGSNDHYLSYNNWLTSASSQFDLQQEIENSESKELSRDNLIAIYNKYNKTYGTTKSFKNFINSLITNEDRKKLLESIRIRKILDGIEQPYEPSDNKKINFLFEIRNSFTHTGKPYASPAGGVFEDDGAGTEIDGVIKYGYRSIHCKEKGDIKYEYTVRKWPQLLIEIVENYISSLTSY